MNYQRKKIRPRYTLISVVFILIGLAIICKASYIMFVKRDYWEQVNKLFVKDSVIVKPVRGNIIAAGGELLSSSLNEYKIYLDFVAKDRDEKRTTKAQHIRDSLLDTKMDSICQGLHRIMPDQSVEYYKNRIEEGRKRKSKYWLLYPKRISFVQYKAVCRLPFFKLRRNVSGFYAETFTQRINPYGSLAGHTIGTLFLGKDSARYGLEMAFDSVLRGKPGITRRQKVRSRYLSLVEVPPEDGLDIQTTLDVSLQDFCEKAITDQLREVEGNVGVVIVMEVATGDVKAIVNMERAKDGNFYERQNHAVSDLLEPGSVFKTASFMVAFEDGMIHMTDSVNTGGGIAKMYGRDMKDHNWRRGGYQWLTVPEVLEYSSNIGVSTLIDRYYHRQPQRYVDGLHRIGIDCDLHLTIPGYARPRILGPRERIQARQEYARLSEAQRKRFTQPREWSATSLPWMSIGYESQVPPISTLAFYNGIANGGKLVRPRFVKAAMRKGEVVIDYPVEVLREKMCSSSALKNIQTCLEWVVSRGLGKKAGSPNFSVSGKTGTAQVWGGSGFTHNYLVSFAGYFPSEHPQYSCIVCIRKSGMPASGGGQCGPVFHKIAENLMARQMQSDVIAARDSSSIPLPFVKGGNLLAADIVLKHLGISCQTDWSGKPIQSFNWGKVESSSNIVMTQENFNNGLMPDFTDMGLRDAVYLLEKLHLRASFEGIGKVKEQSIPAGAKIARGACVHLIMGCKNVEEAPTTTTTTTAGSAKDSAKRDSDKNRPAATTPTATTTKGKAKEPTEKPKKEESKKEKPKTEEKKSTSSSTAKSKSSTSKSKSSTSSKSTSTTSKSESSESSTKSKSKEKSSSKKEKSSDKKEKSTKKK